MKKFINKSTPISIILNLILIINCIIVLYPVLFTISSSFSVSSSLAASSVIPFTSQKDTTILYDCDVCGGKGTVIREAKKEEKIDGEVVLSEEGEMEFDCEKCGGTGKISKLKSSFSFKKP